MSEQSTHIHATYKNKTNKHKKNKLKRFRRRLSLGIILIGSTVIIGSFIAHKFMLPATVSPFAYAPLTPSDPFDDSFTYPEALLELASKKSETIDFVASYKDFTLNQESALPISVKADYVPGEIPLFIQWDKRWGYEKYGNEFIAINGCGPTSLSMVAVGLTGNTDYHPKAVADMSYEEGYLVEGQGSSWSLMTSGASILGLTSQELPLSDNIIYEHLNAGEPIIASMRPGDFTTSGHFIVLVGATPEGKIIVHDPDSILRSEKEWDLDVLTPQIKNLWAFSL